MKKLIYKLNSVNLQKRFIFIFVLLIIAPLIFQGVVSLSILSNEVTKRYESEMEYRFSQLNQDINELFSECKQALFEFAYNKEIQTTLYNNNVGASSTGIESRYIVEKILLDDRLKSGIAYSVYVYDLNGNCYTNNYMDIIRYEELNTSESDSKHLFSCTVHEELMRERNYSDIIMSRPIFDDGGRKKIGTVAIKIETSNVKSLCSKAFEGATSANTVIDRDGNVVISDVYKSGENIYDDIDKEHFDFSKRTIATDGKFLFISSSDSRGWQYIADINQAVINSSRTEMLAVFYIILASAFIISLFVLLYINTTIISPINKLSVSINAVESADTAELTFKPKYNDEIGQLANSYNNMTIKLKNSVKRIKSIEKSKQRAEMRMLQEQINPHFLYNTLSSTIWLVHKDKKNDAINMLEALAGFYQLSVNNGREKITVKEEFLHIENYLKIQEMRYKGIFIYELSCDENVADYYIIKIILQPLVENAIYHGVKNLGVDGLIKVQAFLKEETGRICLQVIDNGKGLTQEKCKLINDCIENNRQDALGIGVSNVMNRIKLYYGSECSMYYSVSDEYTTVTIEIPAKSEDEYV